MNFFFSEQRGNFLWQMLTPIKGKKKELNQFKYKVRKLNRKFPSDIKH